MPDRLISSSKNAKAYLTELVVNGVALPKHDIGVAKIELDDYSHFRCISYTVNIKEAQKEGRIPRAVNHFDNSIIMHAAPLLWLPEKNRQIRKILLRFILPEGLKMSVPWYKVSGEDNTYLLDLGKAHSRLPALMGIGEMEIRQIPTKTSTLRLAVVGSKSESDFERTKKWIEQGVLATQTVFNSFPVSSQQILVVDLGAGKEPVPWGQVLRGGNPAIQLFIHSDHNLNEFLSDWTLVHELSHFFHPGFDRTGTWLGEGLATYYQNLIQSRHGILSEREAWRRLHAGFQRGLLQTQVGHSLRQESLSMSDTHRYMRVYWSGAAIALMADVHLRQRGLSLDKTLHDFQQCCSSKRSSWDPEAFMEKLDQIADSEVFSSLFERYFHSDQFPDLKKVYDELGLRVIGSNVHFSEEERAVKLRMAIMRGTLD